MAKVRTVAAIEAATVFTVGPAVAVMVAGARRTPAAEAPVPYSALKKSCFVCGWYSRIV